MKRSSFTAPNGEKMELFFREETNDYYTILSAFVEDQCGISEVNWQPGDVMIDAGAHIGEASLLSLTYPGVTVYAYEPIEENVALLRKNVEHNGLQDRIHIFRKVVWSRAGRTIRVYLRKDPVHRWIGSVFGWENKDFQLVRTTSLSEILRVNRIEECKMLKLTVQGSEYETLRAASVKTLSRIEKVHGLWHDYGQAKGSEASRAGLLSLTKGVHRSETEGEPPGVENSGQFRFVKIRD